ncbi:HAD family hydrolase [Streptomyces sp. NPDC051133]|uniref:HAD family hydrolase n=1 Tax=Streptomyces sp. NPDC051133 TaxID=3155521 RepID=UPI00341E211A
MTGQPRRSRPSWAGVRAVSFDLGGTLVRPEAQPTTGQVAELLGISLAEARTLMEQKAKRRRISPADLAGEVAADFQRPDLVGSLTSVLERARHRASEPDVYDDVRPTLAALREQGLALFAMTNSLGSSIPEHAPAAFRDLTQVIYSAETGAVKPERAAFAAVESASGLSPHELLHVGNSLRADVDGATAAGWHTAWLNRTRADIAVPSDTVCLHSLTTLPLLLSAVPTPVATRNSEAR